MINVNNNPVKVSVIIPVYNTETYVRQAVDSICRQTLREIEIIVINDGSTDGSLRLLQQMAQKDSRIKVHTQTNSGQSVARNNAMKYATGKYLYFMDSDDMLDPEALENCFQKCEENKLDFVFFDAEILNQESRYFRPFRYNRSGCVDEAAVHTGKVMLQKQLECRAYTSSPCLSLTRRNFIRQLRLQFYPGIIHEDELFSAVLYLFAQRVMYIQKSFYKRRFREASTMTQPFSWRNVKGYLTVADELQQLKKHRAADEQKPLIDLLLQRVLNAAVRNARALPVQQRLYLCFLCIGKSFRHYVSKRLLTSVLVKTSITDFASSLRTNLSARTTAI